MSSSSSSTNMPTAPSSSTVFTPEQTAYMNQFNAQTKPQTIGQIRAAGEVKTRIAIIWFVGIVCTLLIIIGGISLIRTPDAAKDVWVIIGPILSSAITGTVAYFTGEKQSVKS